MPVINGKWYFECKIVAAGTSPTIGICDIENWANINGAAGYAFHDDSENFGYGSDGQKFSGGGSSFGDSFTDDDIIGVAVDCTNHKLYFSKNGTWENSGDPTSGATVTGAVAISATPKDGCYYFSVTGYEDVSITFEANFGNGYFGTTAVSSAGTNASGNGIFEYDVPTGYSALCTKGLNL